ncbi:hypothetical protein ACFFLS_09820 [Flavobacterium procerum]|uniref:Uncharacterized protein n=1 Tax=Flavobacterium procerum TaxID=1455569 RepID=A0ABV6BTH5_9FLAO
MKLKVVIFFILIILNSCSKNKKPSELKSNLKIDTSRVSIIKYDSANLDCKMVFKTGTNSYLNKEDLDKIEFAIDKIIEKQNPIQIEKFKEISKRHPEENYKKEDFILKKTEYIRRYLVIKNIKGEKEIYVALVCDEIAKYSDFRKTLKQGHGGGSCLFSFKLNFDTNEYYDIQFNAEA